MALSIAVFVRVSLSNKVVCCSAQELRNEYSVQPSYMLCIRFRTLRTIFNFG